MTQKLRGQLLVGVLGIAGLLIACGPSAEQEVEHLRGMPEAQLAYPGSEEVARGGDGTTETVTGTSGAFAWRTLRTDATVDELFEWFATRLESDGWVVSGGSSGIRGTGELQATAWERDGLIVRLSALDPERTRADWLGDASLVYRTSIRVDTRSD
jgi:hypothetical protein